MKLLLNGVKLRMENYWELMNDDNNETLKIY